MKINFYNYEIDKPDELVLTEDQKEKILQKVCDYFTKHDASSGDTIMQMDTAYIGAVDTMIDICDILFGK